MDNDQQYCVFKAGFAMIQINLFESVSGVFGQSVQTGELLLFLYEESGRIQE